VMPDVERIVADHLRYTLDGPKVVTELPRDKTWPLVRVHRYGGRDVTPGEPLHLDAALIQVDVWADTVAQARTIAEACRAAIHTIPHQPDAGGVVTRSKSEEMRRVDDASFTPAKPRYAVRATVHCHP
jgi:hypothetical protein